MPTAVSIFPLSGRPLTDAGNNRHVDVHPVVEDGRLGWWQHGFDGERFEYPTGALANGVIGGRNVRCLAAEKQLELHGGYAPAPQDLADIRLLEQLVG